MSPAELVARETPASRAVTLRPPKWRRILLSATGLIGTLCFGGRALADRLRALPAPAL